MLSMYDTPEERQKIIAEGIRKKAWHEKYIRPLVADWESVLPMHDDFHEAKAKYYELQDLDKEGKLDGDLHTIYQAWIDAQQVNLKDRKIKEKEERAAFRERLNKNFTAHIPKEKYEEFKGWCQQQKIKNIPPLPAP